MDDGLTARIRETLVARRADQFQFVQALVRAASPVPPGDASTVMAVTAAGLKDLSLVAEQHDLTGEAAARHGLVHAGALVARYVFGAGPAVALLAHGDTGPAPAAGNGDPFAGEITSGVLTGLGAVAKAEIAVYAHALAALIDARPELAGTVELHVTFDGAADGALGPKWLLAGGVVNPDYVIAGGVVHGIGTHAMGDLQVAASLEPLPGGDGGDLMAAAGMVLNALHDVGAAYGHIRSPVPGIGSPTLVVGAIEGGARADTPPERVTIRLDRRLIPEEDPATVEADLTDLIAAVASATPGVVCRIRRLSASAPIRPGPGSGRLAETVRRQAERVLGTAVASHGVAFDANSRHYAAVGIPVLFYGAGAEAGGDGNRLNLDDLRKATEVVAVALADYLTPAG